MDVTWAPVMITYTGTNTEPGLRVFSKPEMTQKEHSIFRDLLDAFARAMSKANVTFFLYGGSLVGSWRHHGMIPWDDDIDLAVPNRQFKQAFTALTDLAPTYRLTIRHRHCSKFFSNDSPRKIRRWPWKWPFLDVCFYEENTTHVISPDISFFPEYVFPKEEVFPLGTRPFEGCMLPVPGKTWGFLNRTYNLSKCLVGSHEHRTEQPRSKRERGSSVDCHRLWARFPFVHRVSMGEAGCNETLVQDSLVLGWYYDRNQTC